ncbi:MAG: oxidoreductase, partial [Zoogloea sp.]|nr:oxidoreductase [Zoogloea sp.]
FSGLNLTTDFIERDVVFGGEAKLERAIAEADRLFPLHRGMSLLSTCPIALIGDDTEGVARRRQRALGKPVVAVHCAGYRRGDGIGDTHATLTGTWQDWAAPHPARAGKHDVVLLCRETGGAWQGIAQLLEQLGLKVVARWPAATSRGEIGRLGHGRLAVSIGMEYWARHLQRRFGLPWVEADFLGLAATCDSLRAIAAQFDEDIRQRAEALIAAHAPAAQAVVDAARQRIAGRLLLSFAPLHPRDIRAYAEFGLRAGSTLQGWPDRDGRWRMPPHAGRYHELPPGEVAALLELARPDLVDGLGQDGLALRKQGYAIFDDRSRTELARASIGFAGVARLADEFLRLFASPLAGLEKAPWAGSGTPHRRESGQAQSRHGETRRT